MKRSRIGMTAGKFLPLHRGHTFLLRRALGACDELHVLVCETARDAWPGAQRARWIRECVSGVAHVHVIDQDARGLADDDSVAWARVAREVLDGASPDVVILARPGGSAANHAPRGPCSVTSEAYGERWAAELACRHEAIDPERANVPVSGTLVRSAVLEHLAWVEPPVRRDLALRVCVVGAESTGKTTLCSDLAEHFGVPFVPEFGRHYCEAMADATRYAWSHADFATIARTQARFERDAAGWVGALVLCDTTPHTTSVFERAYLGSGSDPVAAIAAECRYDLAILTDVATPFHPDDTGLRDESARAWMHAETRAWAAAQGAFVEVSGARSERVEQAAAAVVRLLGGTRPVVLSDSPDLPSSRQPSGGSGRV